MDAIVHKFQEAGLGVAPFRLVAIEERRYCPAPGISMVGGACAYCGTGIVQCCIIQDAHGKRFIVGNECVNKTGDAGLINLTKKAINRVRAQAREVSEQAAIKEMRARLDTDEALRAKLDAMPHPYEWAQKQGQTFLSSILWMMSHAGRSGQMRTVRQIRKIESGQLDKQSA